MALAVGALALLARAAPAAAAQDPPLGEAYRGPKCVVAVGEFAVNLEGAPAGIGPGLRQMLTTALFESNYFLVAKREVAAGVAGSELLSDKFLDDPEAILNAGKTAPAEILISGALIDMEDGGIGLRVKVPGAPVAAGGSLSEVRVMVQLQATETASGRIVAAQKVEGTARAGKASVGRSAFSAALPIELQAMSKTPLELAFRDCIYRAVVGLITTLPRGCFRHMGD
jgi:curli biogenesis system outer membrane secretion channel CsgG